MTSDSCTVCGERTRYDGHEIAHSCAGGVPASNLPEREVLLVSISEMNRRIAERDAEVARLTAENDRLIVIAKADEWQARYWAEHDAVADREATIMAERATAAAMRDALEPFAEWSRSLRKSPSNLSPSCPLSIEPEAGPVIVAVPRSPGRTKCVADLHEAEAALQSDAGKALLDAHAAELARQDRDLLAVAKERDTVQDLFDCLVDTLGVETEYSNLRSLADVAEEAEEQVAALRQRAEAAEANLIEARKTAEGHREPCYYCDNPTNNLAAFPGEWSVGLCHGDDPGRLKWHHVSCVSERLARLDATRATCDGSAERSHTESTKAAIAALWETSPEIAYESPAQVIVWLKGRVEAAELFRATVERPQGLRSGQCCDPVIDGEICALLRRVEAAEAALRQIASRHTENMTEATYAYCCELAERTLGGEGK